MCIRGSKLFPYFSCFSCFSWLNPSFAIRVHSCAFVVLISPISFMLFVPFVVKYFFCYSCLFVCIRGSSSPLSFPCLSCFSWLNNSFAIRVHSWFFLSPLLIFMLFVLFVVKSFFCYSCSFVSIRGSELSHYFHAFRGLIIRIHSWFDIPVRPVLRRALGEPTAANPVEGLTLWGVIRNPCRLALPTLPFNSPWQFPVPNILVRNSCATPG